MHALLLSLLACSIKDKTPGNPSDGDDSGGGYQSDFSTGQYRLSAFTIVSSDEGRDWDGDGQVDNNLPNVLQTFAHFVPSLDLSKNGLNSATADAIDEDRLVLLVDANFDGALTLDFLAGLVDNDGNLVVDVEESYDEDGEPISHMVGEFTSETEYEAGPDPLMLAIPVTAVGTLAPFPLEDVYMDGHLGTVTLDGTMAGLVPVAQFVEGVLPVVIPAGGYDIDGDGTMESQAEIIALVTQILDTFADVVTESGEPGISAAIHFSANAAAF